MERTCAAYTMSPLPPPLPPAIPERPHGAEAPSEQSQSQQLMKWLLIPLGCIIVMLIFLLAMLILGPAGGSSADGSTDGDTSEGKALGAQSRSTGGGVATTGPNNDVGGKMNADATTTAAPDKQAAAPAVDAAATAFPPTDRPTPATTDAPPAKPTEERPFIGIFTPNESENSPVIGSLAPGGENPFLSRQNEASTIFVIDKSGSMAGGNLQRVVAALEEAIDRLQEKQSFQVVFFDTQPYYNSEMSGLSPATAANKRIAIDWIHQVQAAGGTEPLEAMLAAIQLRPVRIVLLSDGEFDPSYAGEITKANHTGSETPIKIDCVGVAETVVSLQEIARDNGPGIYFQAK